MRTTITITTETWKRLNDLKQTPNDSFDSVVNKLLDNRRENNAPNEHR